MTCLRYASGLQHEGNDPVSQKTHAKKDRSVPVDFQASMGGIAGYVRFTRAEPERQDGLEILGRLIPDCSILEKSLVTDWCGIGVSAEPGRRNASAPKDCSGDSLTVLGCGEVYNADAGSPCDAIRRLYQDDRLEGLADLNGPFAAAICDPEKGAVVLVNDRYGLYPIYYHSDAACFCFSQKIRTLLRAGADRTLRKDAVTEFLSLGYLPGDNTFFEHIFRVPPASIVTISAGGVRIRRYWQCRFNGRDDTRTEDELIGEMAGVLRKAVQRRIGSGEEVIIPLSGGLDSRAILAAALESTPREKIVTFTFGERGSWDADIGRMVADIAGVRHISLGVDAANFEEQYRRRFEETEGMIDATPYYPVGRYRAMREYGTRILSGYLGGTITGARIPGTLRHEDSRAAAGSGLTPESIVRRQAVTDPAVVERLCSPEGGHRKVLASVGVSVAGNTIQHPADQYVVWDMMNRHSRYTPLAVFRDRDAFLYALPFVDNDYVDFMISVPLRFRADQYLYKKMLLTTYPDLYALPTKNTQGMPITSNGPAVVLRRVSKVAKTAVNILSSAMLRKTLFLNPGLNYLDYDDLLRTNHEYRDFVHRMIGRLQQRDLFDNRYLTGLWILHMLGFRNSATLFGLLVTYEMFLEEFADEPGSAGSTQSDPATG